MGSEGYGISEEMRSSADALFFIPMKGFAESFNLAAASAIVCAYLDAQGALQPDMGPNVKRRLLLTWLARSVESSMAVLRKAGLKVEGSRPPYELICGMSTRP